MLPASHEKSHKYIFLSMTKKKASGGDENPAELFQTLEMMLSRYCTQYAINLWKISGHWTGESQFSFQSQRRAIPKKVQTRASTICDPRTSRCISWIQTRERNQRWNCQHPWHHSKRKVFQKNIYFYFIDYGKIFDCVDHNNLWKILKEIGISDHLTCFLRNLYAGQEATVINGHLDMG